MTHRGQRNGFTLVEVALSLAILGLVLGAVVTTYNVAQQQKKMRVTRERMDQIVRALSTYVESADRLPCPSDPASPEILPLPAPQNPAAAVLGWERGVTLSQTTITSTLPTGNCTGLDEASGVVPFNTLGISYDTISDGWGHYFTYAVSPVFTQKTDESGTKDAIDTGSVHALCRTPRWISDNDNINGPKAKFCCALGGDSPLGSETDIVMLMTTDPANTPLLPRRNGGDYTVLDQRFSGIDPAPRELRDAIAAPAFVLISHGPDGAGAYLVNGTDKRVRFTGPDTDNVFEHDNAETDPDPTVRTYRIGPVQSGAGPDHFDDVVVWMTQAGLMAYNGTSSCALP